jgi:ADP-L-glycero-D-manno-heptose 6-epimerase
MIVITGAAGFIGSVLVSYLNKQGYNNLVLVDDFSYPEKNKNFAGKKFEMQIERTDFIDWVDENEDVIDFIFHLGARTDTTEFDTNIFDKLNLNYSIDVWNKCVQYSIPLVYASSGATYGLGELGFKDDHQIVKNLKPLNPYGDSKNDFDKWVLKQKKSPFFWAGLKFFNVYGPNEYHKGRMASVILHAHRQISETNQMKLFRSHREDYQDGMQLRDFIYVKDVVSVCYFLMNHRKDSGLYNLGTGTADSFHQLAVSTFEAMAKDVAISFVDTPEDIRDKYQYFTEADMTKLQSIGYTQPFISLKDGAHDYVKNYLMKNEYY